MECNNIVAVNFDDWFAGTYMHVFRWFDEPDHDSRLDCGRSDQDNTPSFGQGNHHDL